MIGRFLHLAQVHQFLIHFLITLNEVIKWYVSNLLLLYRGTREVVNWGKVDFTWFMHRHKSELSLKYTHSDSAHVANWVQLIQQSRLTGCLLEQTWLQKQAAKFLHIMWGKTLFHSETHQQVLQCSFIFPTACQAGAGASWQKQNAHIVLTIIHLFSLAIQRFHACSVQSCRRVSAEEGRPKDTQLDQGCLVVP